MISTLICRLRNYSEPETQSGVTLLNCRLLWKCWLKELRCASDNTCCDTGWNGRQSQYGKWRREHCRATWKKNQSEPQRWKLMTGMNCRSTTQQLENTRRDLLLRLVYPSHILFLHHEVVSWLSAVPRCNSYTMLYTIDIFILWTENNWTLSSRDGKKCRHYTQDSRKETSA